MLTINEIKKIAIPVLKKHLVPKAGLFGSYATGKNTYGSDVDIVVEVDQSYSLIDLVGIKIDLEEILKTKVDLATYNKLRPGIKERILGEEIRFYG